MCRRNVSFRRHIAVMHVAVYRQRCYTILERLGWRFIRIRGSEYYRDAQQTMQRVMQELTDFEIMPEETQEFTPRTRDTELLQRVKTRAHALMQKREQPDVIDVETIRSALQA